MPITAMDEIAKGPVVLLGLGDVCIVKASGRWVLFYNAEGEGPIGRMTDNGRAEEKERIAPTGSTTADFPAETGIHFGNVAALDELVDLLAVMRVGMLAEEEGSLELAT